jgi:hypothetical protein
MFPWTWLENRVQLEMERRQNFALEYSIQKLEYATTSNPFAGRVICGSCGQIFGRYGTQPMKGLEELSGDATANIRRRGKRAAKAGILTMGLLDGTEVECIIE